MRRGFQALRMLGRNFQFARSSWKCRGTFSRYISRFMVILVGFMGFYNAYEARYVNAFSASLSSPQYVLFRIKHF